MVILYIILGLAVVFGFVVLFGAPYLPTLKKQTEEALDLLDLQPGQTLLELGSGDGRVMLAAARRGLKVVGYELNPLLCLAAVIVTWRYRRQVSVRWGNYWGKKWPPAEGIFVFLYPKFMSKLHKKIVQDVGGDVKLVSYAFPIPDRKPDRVTGPLYLYRYRPKN